MTSGWLLRPAPEAARAVALRLLGEAVAGRQRLGSDEPDAEALHDFRVALRRLRSWLRAFRPQLEDTLRGRARRRLSRIADATGTGRDLEVLVELAARLKPVTVAERAALAELKGRLLDREHEAEAGIADAVAQFDEARPELEAALSAWMQPVSGVASSPPPLAAVMAARLQEQSLALREALAQAVTPEHQSEAHAARIAAKRVRYLLEPLAASEPDAKRCVKRLKALQDVLGDMHDAHVLEQEAAELAAEAAAPAGAAPLVARVARRVRALHARLRKEWLAGGLDDLMRRIAAVEQQLTARAGEGMEHERKYLLSGMPPRALKGRRSVLEQGWLPGSRIVERVRRERSGRVTRWWRTIKAGRGVSRIEAEEATTERVFRALWPLTAGKRVRKERFFVRAGGLTWEIDRFLDIDLVLAEVELPGGDAEVPMPDWLAPYVVREVTTEDAYVNLNLAR